MAGNSQIGGTLLQRDVPDDRGLLCYQPNVPVPGLICNRCNAGVLHGKNKSEPIVIAYEHSRNGLQSPPI
jgi:hypothetical protein